MLRPFEKLMLALALFAALALLTSESKPVPSLPGTGSGQDVLNPKRCDITQLVLATCPNLVQASFDDGRHGWSLSFAGPVALYEKLERYGQKPATVMIRDYATMESERPRMIHADRAWFLYGAEGDEAVAQPPFIYAFKTKDAALKAQGELHGDLLQWAAVAKRAKAYAAEWDPHAKENTRYNLDD